MEAIVVIIIGSILIVFLKKLPTNKDRLSKRSLPQSISALFSSFKKHSEDNKQPEQTNEKSMFDLLEEDKKQNAIASKEEMLEKADSLLKANNLDQAEDLYIKVLKDNPKNAKSYKGLGQICFKKKDYKDALEIFQKLVEISSKDSSAYCNLGMCYFKKKDFKKAIESYKKAIKIEKKAFYLKNLAITYYSDENYKEAVETFFKALQLGDNNEKSILLMKDMLKKISDKKRVEKITKFIEKISKQN